MDSGRWEQIKSIFHDALTRPEAGRLSFVESACGADRQMMAEILAMLQADAAGSSLLDSGLPDIAYEIVGAPSESILLREFGPYRLQEVLGEGGMGVVWLAERVDTGNPVAIKFLPHAALSPARRERFAIEIKTLAKLRHQFIARLYDAGSLPDGTPWFAMEYVDGLRFTEYCRQTAIPMREKLELFRSVCEAVQYAHGQEIIHRDLKPSNILVEADGTPKLLDFGIARQLQQTDGPEEQTRPGLRFISPDYAAPEWARDGIVGPYTDVYSLGVTLYRMLAGRLPFDRSKLDAERVNPEKPSIAANGESGVNGQTTAPAQLSRAEWNDLDTLCLKAIRQDPAQRYQSVEALLRDIDHYLKDEPLEAKPDTWGYRAAKFVRRNRRAVIAASLAFILIAGQLIFFTVRLARARDAAVAEAARTKRIQRFMVNLLDDGDQEAGPSNELRVSSLLDRGAQEAATLRADPETQAELYKTIGTMYQRLGKFQKADGMLQPAAERMRAARGPADPGYGGMLTRLGLLRGDEARFKDAEQLTRQGLTIASRSLRTGDPIVVDAQWALGQVLAQSGAYDKAIAVLEPLVPLKPSGEEEAVTLADVSTALGYANQNTQHYGAAESFYRRGLAMDNSLFGPAHPRVASDLANLGSVEVTVGREAEAEKSYRQAVRIMKAWYGPDHPETAEISSFLAMTLSREGKNAEAEPILQQVLAIEERARGASHPTIAFILSRMGNLALKRGDFAAAEADLSRAVSINKASYGENNYQTAITMEDLGNVFLKEKRYSQAESILQPAVRFLSTQPASGNVSLAIGQVSLGSALVRQKRYREAEPYLIAGYAVFSKEPARTPTRLREAREDLAELYGALNQPGRAGEFRRELGSASAQEQGSSSRNSRP